MLANAMSTRMSPLLEPTSTDVIATIAPANNAGQITICPWANDVHVDRGFCMSRYPTCADEIVTSREFVSCRSTYDSRFVNSHLDLAMDLGSWRMSSVRLR